MREQRSAGTNRRVLDAARRLFTTQGYRQTTIAQIAQEAGVVAQTIYNGIGGKSAILIALNDIVDEAANVGPLQRQIGQSTDPQEIVRLTVELRSLLMKGAGDIVGLLMAAAGSEPDVARVYADGQARSRSGCQRIVQRLDAIGWLRPELDIDSATDALYALLHHTVWTRLEFECGWPPEKVSAWYCEVLESALVRQEP